MSTRPEARDYLRKVGEQADADIELAEAALMLAVLDRPSGDLDSYRHHLAELAEDAAGRVPAGAEDVVAARVAAEGGVGEATSAWVELEPTAAAKCSPVPSPVGLTNTGTLLWVVLLLPN